MSDAHARLLAYLRQRRELGESEFVLDGVSVEEAYRVLAQRASPPSAPASSGGRPASAGVADARPIPAPPDSASRRAAAEAAKDGDWREALKAIDAAPASRAKAPAERPVVRPEESAVAGTMASAEGAVPPALASRSTAPVPPQDAAYRIEVGSGAPGSGLSDLASLDAVAAAIARCGACALGATARNHVPGEGNPSARFVVVGEAPGETEDELGRPFVGKSGELLNKILEAIGFKREDVFICNVLKHRPPGNRNPTPAEVAACRPFLLRQLELLQPKIILALGTFAAQTLLETDSPIGKLRGLEHRYHGIPLVATYHPAALLRNPNWKRPAWEDVQLARRIFDRP